MRAYTVFFWCMRNIEEKEEKKVIVFFFICTVMNENHKLARGQEIIPFAGLYLELHYKAKKKKRCVVQ